MIELIPISHHAAAAWLRSLYLAMVLWTSWALRASRTRHLDPLHLQSSCATLGIFRPIVIIVITCIAKPDTRLRIPNLLNSAAPSLLPSSFTLRRQRIRPLRRKGLLLNSIIMTRKPIIFLLFFPLDQHLTG